MVNSLNINLSVRLFKSNLTSGKALIRLNKRRFSMSSTRRSLLLLLIGSLLLNLGVCLLIPLLKLLVSPNLITSTMKWNWERWNSQNLLSKFFTKLLTSKKLSISTMNNKRSMILKLRLLKSLLITRMLKTVTLLSLTNHPSIPLLVVNKTILVPSPLMEYNTMLLMLKRLVSVSSTFSTDPSLILITLTTLDKRLLVLLMNTEEPFFVITTLPLILSSLLADKF